VTARTLDTAIACMVIDRPDDSADRLIIRSALHALHAAHVRLEAQQATIDAQREELRRYVRSVVQP